MLKYFSFLTLFVVIQCRQATNRKPAGDGTIRNAAFSETNTDSNFPPEGFISYGQRARIGEFPWMTVIETVDFGDGMPYLCGGSLISDQHVITAAHCVVKAVYYTDIKISIGEYRLDSFPRDCVGSRCVVNHITYPTQVTWHHLYDNTSITNDIAVLRFERHVKSDYIRPISLPPFDVDDPKYENAPLTVVGWGLTENLTASQILLKTEVNLKTREQCHKIFDYTYPDGHICAGSSTYRDSCQGDSGGPLMMYYKNKYYISGIVSFSWFGKCGVNPASYYTNVFKYMDWIKWAMQR